MVVKWCRLSTSCLDDILAWAESLSWVKEMSRCRQDTEWHSEGDVWTHTQMVCRQLHSLDDWSDLSPEEKTILVFTGLFHDSAKPLTSIVDLQNGRISSPKHAVRGEKLAREILRELGCDLVTREKITNLVRYHGRPAYLMERIDPAAEVARLSWLVSNRLLYLFSLADHRGRVAKTVDRSEIDLQCWKLMAEENNCFDKPFSFPNEQTRFHFFRNAGKNLHQIHHEDHRCTVTMMSGLPGSGKDTWLSDNRPDLPVVSLDKIRSELKIKPTEVQGEVVQKGRARCREFLRLKQSFAFNATNITARTRQRWVNLFTEYKARVEMIYIEPPMSKIMIQNSRRENPVPGKVISKLVSKCEPPKWNECHSLILVG